MNLLHQGNTNDPQERLSTKHDRPSSAKTLQYTGLPSQALLALFTAGAQRPYQPRALTFRKYGFQIRAIRETFAECLQCSVEAAPRNA